jgi:hypothetical protein
MQDFNDYIKNNKSNPNETVSGEQQNLINLVTKLATKFDGKNTNELIMAIYKEAKRGKENGTLTNRDIDNFATVLSPMLDDKKRKLLYKITEELKNI